MFASSKKNNWKRLAKETDINHTVKNYVFYFVIPNSVSFYVVIIIMYTENMSLILRNGRNEFKLMLKDE